MLLYASACIVVMLVQHFEYLPLIAMSPPGARILTNGQGTVFCLSIYVCSEFSQLLTPLHLGVILVLALLVGLLLACHNMAPTMRHEKPGRLISRTSEY